MAYKAPYLSYEKVRRIADGCLANWNPDGIVPVPVEEIIDCEMKVDVVPVSSLMAHDDEHVPEAFVSKDGSTIYVDDSVYRCRTPHRLRFSLAHEMAHLVLHSSLICSAEFQKYEDWPRFLRSLPDDEFVWVERQAHWFAGLFLVPEDPLASAYARMCARLKEVGLSMTTLEPSAIERVAAEIGREFEVSWLVIHKRAKADKLPNWPADLP